jgi:hypothetical protein
MPREVDETSSALFNWRDIAISLTTSWALKTRTPNGIFNWLDTVFGCGPSLALTASVPFYPTVLIAIAAYYVLFAAMGASRRAPIIEIIVAGGFLLVAVISFVLLWRVEESGRQGPADSPVNPS